MAQTREIKSRIRSIGNTKKITKAMELVAASKMKRAVDRVSVSREYTQIAWQIVQKIASTSGNNKKHPLLKQNHGIKRVAILTVSSNRGLCAGFNTNLAKLVDQAATEFTKQGIEIDFICLGKKIARHILKTKRVVAYDFDKPDLVNEMSFIAPISHILTEGYQKRKYQAVYLVFTDFKSTMKQEPIIKKILPITPKPDEHIGAIENLPYNQDDKLVLDVDEYKFEPSPAKVLNYILPRILDTQIFQAILESDASEHSSRMMAMQNATGAAGDMIDELTLAYNQARQAAITQEIAEIVGAVAAL